MTLRFGPHSLHARVTGHRSVGPRSEGGRRCGAHDIRALVDAGAWHTVCGVTTPLNVPTPTVLLATIGDPDGTRTVTSIIILLVALGVALVMLAVWLHRTTRPDPDVLAPLEVMGERRWRRADPVAQRRMLDEYRPEGAKPLTPSAAPPMIDVAFDAGPSASGFDDLHRDDALGETEREWPPAPVVITDGASTPRALRRPELDDFESAEFDPELLERAQAEIEAELQARPPRD